MQGTLGRAIPEPAKRPRGRPRKTLLEQDDGNRRRALLHSAARLFRRKGFDATSTRDIAAAVGMRSGSPFYHFESKGALLFAVMEEGMRSAIARQDAALATIGHEARATERLDVLVRSHVGVLHGRGSDFIPVMLYESRSVTPAQRRKLATLQRRYEAPWLPLLAALREEGRLRCDIKLARLLMFGAMNWSVQWYDPRQQATLEELADAAIQLFIGD